MQRTEKEEVVAALVEQLRSTESLIVADYRGLTNADLVELRAKVRGSGGRLQVVKNTLTRRAAEEAGTESLLALLEGPTAIAFVQTDGDPVAVAKALADTAKDTKVLTLRGGIGFAGPLYGALEVGFGGLLAPAHADTEMLSSGVFGSPEVAQSNGHLLQAAAVLGAHVTLGDLVVSAEVAGGGRVVDYGFVSSYHGCLQQVWVERGGGIAEARARAEHWVGARSSVGVAIGTSFLDRGAWSGGVFLRMHSRAFGGLY